MTCDEDLTTEGTEKESTEVTEIHYSEITKVTEILLSNNKTL